MLFLDFDGTLSPIARSPDDAQPVAGIRATLQSLVRNPKTKVAIVSGRSLLNLKRKIGLSELICAGNHGLELSEPKYKFTRLFTKKRNPIMNQIAKELKAMLGNIRGAWVENKKMTLSVHYRQVAKSNIQALKNAVLKAVRPDLEQERIRLTSGKRILEIKPNIPWDKGALIRWILLRRKKFGVHNDATLIYIGDDETDESAFKEINKLGGISIFVGSKHEETNAGFLIRTPKQVASFLNRLSKLYDNKND